MEDWPVFRLPFEPVLQAAVFIMILKDCSGLNYFEAIYIKNSQLILINHLPIVLDFHC
ncbi:hypothetical protein ACFO1V_08780 [Daeguia caeni]|uniref:Uncharacterized protein n=1 Tax=Daeguia caeni TaxID=439612 RepID=A0ABV9H860_9HYPH